MKLQKLDFIEVPLGDYQGLTQLKAELEYVLSVVNFALGEEKSAPALSHARAVSAAVAPDNKTPPPQGNTMAERIRDAIDKAPARFKSSDIYSQFPESARTAIKDELGKRRLDGSIIVVTMGKGRIATIYAKKTPAVA